ncbi:MAG: DNA/RNA non-specific endonuclease [Bacillota bacterium]|nr:DNA/RNA non-specific endonuclease [Bacillota bacterium]
MSVKRVIANTAAIGMVLILLLTVPAYAGEYETTIDSFSVDGVSVPAYDGYSSEVVNGNDPLFDAEAFGDTAEADYGSLDGLGRCTGAEGLLDSSLMPTRERGGSLSAVTPSGWVQAKYTGVVSGGWLYNRCHLIGWQLTGTDLSSMPKNELAKNLITGTRYLNVGSGGDGMVEYENEVAAYLREDAENKVAYSVTPIFFDDELVARGVLMQAQSVEEDVEGMDGTDGTAGTYGEDLSYCVFCYNVQPGIAIDYETGYSVLTQSLTDNISIKDCKITMQSGNFPYTGEAIEPEITVKHGDNQRHENMDYILTYENNTRPGKARVIITGVGAFKDSIEKSFIILPAKSNINEAAANKKSIKVTVAEQENVSGYQYSYKLKTKKKWKAVSSASCVKTIKKLKRNKRYSIRVRAYKKIDGKKYYGAWSDVMYIKTKKR